MYMIVVYIKGRRTYPIITMNKDATYAQAEKIATALDQEPYRKRRQWTHAVEVRNQEA